METGEGKMHTELGKLQESINDDVIRGALKSESDLFDRTREAYDDAAGRTGATVNRRALDKSLLSNQAKMHVSTAETIEELKRLPPSAPKVATSAPKMTTTPENGLPSYEGLSPMEEVELLQDQAVATAPSVWSFGDWLRGMFGTSSGSLAGKEQKPQSAPPTNRTTPDGYRKQGFKPAPSPFQPSPY